MKTTTKLAVFAAMTGMAFSTSAASVTLYGSVSTGLVVTHTPSHNADGEKVSSKTSYAMESGWYGDSNWGLTGSEELANGWKAGFTLESNFASDTGELGEEGRLFDSQSYLSIGNDTVTFVAGRIGALSSGGGDFDLLGGFDPMEAKFGIGGMGLFASRDLVANNALAAVVTPVEGLTLAGAVSSGVETDAGEWSDNVHYYALGANYAVDAFAASLIAERVTLPEADDQDFYSLGLSYDFGFVKPMFAYQHGKHVGVSMNSTFEILEDIERIKADSFLVGATAPLAGGNLMVSYQYFTGKGDVSGAKGKAQAFGVAYDYPLSKRTSVFTGATWAKGSKALDKDNAGTEAFNQYTFGVGLKHTF